MGILEEKGWIALYRDTGGRKKEYLITAPGREAAAKELDWLHALVQAAEEIMGGSL